MLEKLTRVFAADALLVADGGDESAAVAGAVGSVEVDREAVHGGADAIVVVELRTADSNDIRVGGAHDTRRNINDLQSDAK